MGGLVLAYQGLAVATEQHFTGVVQSCARVYEHGYSAPSLPPDSGRHGIRCRIIAEREDAHGGAVDVIYDARDPFAGALTPGMSVRVVGAQVGPWASFRPQGYRRNDAPLHLSALLLASGVALWAWGRSAA